MNKRSLIKFNILCSRTVGSICKYQVFNAKTNVNVKIGLMFRRPQNIFMASIWNDIELFDKSILVLKRLIR